MIYTQNTKKAMLLAYEMHKDQIDKGGYPYILHPFHVAEQMTDEDTTIVALLHDVIEDTDMTLDKLKEIGFDDKILQALGLLTHPADLDYFEYIENISRNRIATIVKIADLKHNCDTTRLIEIRDKDVARVEKYKKCIKYLTEKLEQMV